MTIVDSISSLPLTQLRSPFDALLVVVGTHFTYIQDRPLSSVADLPGLPPNVTSLVALVDHLATSQGDAARSRIISLLSLVSAHGRITETEGWVIDCAIHPWMERQSLEDIHSLTLHPSLPSSSSSSLSMAEWRGVQWDVFENQFGVLFLDLIANSSNAIQARL
jgi:hypothetical protein